MNLERKVLELFAYCGTKGRPKWLFVPLVSKLQEKLWILPQEACMSGTAGRFCFPKTRKSGGTILS